MLSLRNIKQAGKLRTKTPLEPVTRNDTRWSSSFAMLERFFRIKEYVDVTDSDLAVNMPTPLETLELQDIMKHLTEFESATKILQDEKITLSDARSIFDKLLEHYPEMHHHISNDSVFVHSPHFENGLVKVIDEDFDKLTWEEKEYLEPFLITGQIQIQSPIKSISYAMEALKSKKRKVTSNEYPSLGHIPPTSNIVERLFSSARLVLTDYRKSMSPYTFECVMFLKVNRKLWDVTMVSKSVSK